MNLDDDERGRSAHRGRVGGLAGGWKAGDEPEQRPERGVAEDAEEIRQRLTNTDGPRPTELMPPDFKPVFWRFPALDDHRREDNASALPGDQIAELIIVGQKIDKSFETANGFEAPACGGHHRAQRKIQRFEASRLEHLIPKI